MGDKQKRSPSFCKHPPSGTLEPRTSHLLWKSHPVACFLLMDVLVFDTSRALACHMLVGKQLQEPNVLYLKCLIIRLFSKLEVWANVETATQCACSWKPPTFEFHPGEIHGLQLRHVEPTLIFWYMLEWSLIGAHGEHAKLIVRTCLCHYRLVHIEWVGSITRWNVFQQCRVMWCLCLEWSVTFSYL